MGGEEDEGGCVSQMIDLVSETKIRTAFMEEYQKKRQNRDVYWRMSDVPFTVDWNRKP